MLAAGELDGRVAWSGPGTVSLDEAAGTRWAPSASGRHRYAVTVVGPEELSGLIDDHLGRPPLAGAWGAIRQETELDAWR